MDQNNISTSSLELSDKLNEIRKSRTEKGPIRNEAGPSDSEVPPRRRTSYTERRSSERRSSGIMAKSEVIHLERETRSGTEKCPLIIRKMTTPADSVLNVEVDKIDPKELTVEIKASPDAESNEGEYQYVVLNDGVLNPSFLREAETLKIPEDYSFALTAFADAETIVSREVTEIELDEKIIEEQKQIVLQDLSKANFEIKRVEKGIQIEDLLEDMVTKGEETAFYLMDVDTVIRKYRQWKNLLPRIKPFYAVKCCPDPVLLRTLRTLDCGFDVASQAEMETVLGLNADPKSLIFANPTKMKAHIQFARDSRVVRMTFDGLAELHKIKEVHPEAELVLRLLPPESTKITNTSFGSKFGATFDDSALLFEKAKELNMNVVGVSYHVGSGCYDVDAFAEAVRYAREVFDLAKEKGFNLTLLDIGGGFPGSDEGPITFKEIAQTIGPLIDQLFPPEVFVLAEPGRYFATECMTLAVNIVSVRKKTIKPSENDEKKEEETKYLYYLSDGVYGSFNCIFFDHAEPVPHLLQPTKKPRLERPARCSTLFGPTCDSIDVICKDVLLPELEVGDWLYFLNMGAYTRAAGSSFNGFSVPKVIYICS